MSVVSLTSRFADVQLANVPRRFANVIKLLKCVGLTIYQICLKIFSLAVEKRTKNNLYMYALSLRFLLLFDQYTTQEPLSLNLFIPLPNYSFYQHSLFFGDE